MLVIIDHFGALSDCLTQPTLPSLLAETPSVGESSKQPAWDGISKKEKRHLSKKERMRDYLVGYMANPENRRMAHARTAAWIKAHPERRRAIEKRNREKPGYRQRYVLLVS